MKRKVQIVVAAAAGAGIGLAAAAAVAAPVAETWQTYVLPAFAGLLTTLLSCF